MIENAENPRCFKGIKKANLPVFYASNGKSLMTAEIFIGFLRRLNLFLQNRRKKAILLMDNAAVHNIAKLQHNSNVEVKFLPANTKAVCQPLDQSIIRAWKSRYLSLLLKRLISVIDTVENVSDLLPEINVKQSIDFCCSCLKRSASKNYSKLFPQKRNLESSISWRRWKR